MSVLSLSITAISIFVSSKSRGSLFLLELASAKESEVNISALKFGISEMINEGIEILNDEGGSYSHIKEHTIGSMLTPQGIEQITCYAIAYTLNTLPKEDDNTPSIGLRSNSNA